MLHVRSMSNAASARRLCRACSQGHPAGLCSQMQLKLETTALQASRASIMVALSKEDREQIQGFLQKAEGGLLVQSINGLHDFS